MYSDKTRLGITNNISLENIKIQTIKKDTRQIKDYEIPYYLEKIGIYAYEIYYDYLKNKLINNNNIYFNKLKKYSIKKDIFLSIHAPFYISPTSQKDNVLSSSTNLFHQMYLMCDRIGAKRFVLHPGGYNGLDPKRAVKKASKFIEESLDSFEYNYPEKSHLLNEIGCFIENLGKKGEIGDIEEIVDILKNVDRNNVLPCVDFGHIYARNLGAIDYYSIIDYINDELGRDVVENLHIHISKIQFGKSGERKHLPNNECRYGPNFDPYFEILENNDRYKHVIINETPEDQYDVLNLWETYSHIFK